VSYDRTVLGITTSTPRGSVAVADGSKLLGSVAYEGEMHHAERLFGAMERLLDEIEIERASLDAIACDVGPGSFTGVRAGLAAAKGIALALSLPLVPVGALEAMAAAAWADPAATDAEHVACLVDAKRGETFFAVYDRALHALAGPTHLRSEDVRATLEGSAPWLKRPLGLVGEQAKELAIPSDRTIVTDDSRLPAAGWIARIGAQRAAGGQLLSLDEVDAVYVRAPDAVPQAGLEPRSG
jgi:tRNA threonylcarbamoyladenosine biosynthesis protein TsaB